MMEPIMRTTVNIDDDILRDLMKFTQAKTQTEAVNSAVAEWVRRKRIDALRARRGKIEWDGDLSTLRAAELLESEQTHG